MAANYRSTDALSATSVSDFSRNYGLCARDSKFPAIGGHSWPPPIEPSSQEAAHDRSSGESRPVISNAQCCSGVLNLFGPYVRGL